MTGKHHNKHDKNEPTFPVILFFFFKKKKKKIIMINNEQANNQFFNVPPTADTLFKTSETNKYSFAFC